MLIKSLPTFRLPLVLNMWMCVQADDGVEQAEYDGKLLAHEFCFSFFFCCCWFLWDDFNWFMWDQVGRKTRE